MKTFKQEIHTKNKTAWNEFRRSDHVPKCSCLVHNINHTLVNYFKIRFKLKTPDTSLHRSIKYCTKVKHTR